MTEIKIGKYKHFKGGEYYVIGIAKHTTTNDELVIYIDKDKNVWARPKDEFLGTVDVDGKLIPRFTYMECVAVSTPSVKLSFFEWWENGAKRYAKEHVED